MAVAVFAARAVVKDMWIRKMAGDNLRRSLRMDRANVGVIENDFFARVSACLF